MFAIHYFFESEEKLEGFLNNVTTNIKKDGIFMCSFMDGDSVERALGSEGIIEGRRNLDNTNILVWAIIKRFIKEDGFYNKKIDVFIENTRRLIPEYLVNFDFLIEKAKQFGLELVESELFSQSFNDYMKKINKNKLTSLDKIMLNLDKEEIQKRFSFFNRWAIFKKID
jgi:mRNA (guanine-N7-)-methyltransferase